MLFVLLILLSTNQFHGPSDHILSVFGM